MAHAHVIESCIGSFSRWQLCVFLMVFLVNFPLAMQELSITLLAPPITYNCSDPSMDVCSENCPSIVYDMSLFDSTITEEWQLICNKEWLQDFAQTILMAGILVGNVIFGFLADKFGRRRPLFYAIVLEIITGIGMVFCTKLWIFLLLRFLVAVAAGGTLVIAFVIVVEVVGRKYRSTCGILFQLTYYIGHGMLGLIGYLIRDWRYIQLTISLPVVLLISYYWTIPESPRWLLTVGRLEEAIEVMEKAAKINKLPPESVRYTVTTKMQNVRPLEENVLDLLKNPNVRTKTICICINWAILGLSFFGVAQYMGQINGNIFINIALAGLIQIPGNIVIIFLVQKVGRKITMIATYLLCAVACISIIFVPCNPSWIVSFLGSISMMGISLSFATMFVWSGELYPTVVRNVGMGTSAMFAKAGSMVAPFLDHSGYKVTWIPPLVFGVAPLIGVLICLKLPETLNTKMPDTVEEAELFGQKIPENITQTTS